MSDPNEEMSDEQFEEMQLAAMESLYYQEMEQRHAEELQREEDECQAYLEAQDEQWWHESHGDEGCGWE